MNPHRQRWPYRTARILSAKREHDEGPAYAYRWQRGYSVEARARFAWDEEKRRRREERRIERHADWLFREALGIAREAAS